MKQRELLNLPVGEYVLYETYYADKNYKPECLLIVQELNSACPKDWHGKVFFIKDIRDSYSQNSVSLTFKRTKMKISDYDEYYLGEKVLYEYWELSASAGPTCFKVHSVDIFSALYRLKFKPRSSYKEWAAKLDLAQGLL